MEILIKTIPHEDQAYPTVGNWRWENDGELLVVEVSELGDRDAEIDVAIHEIIESRLCQKHGISDQSVTNFDLQFEKEREAGKHHIDAEPGDDERAPYRNEHQSAEFVERAGAAALGIDWVEYSEKIHDL